MVEPSTAASSSPASPAGSSVSTKYGKMASELSMAPLSVTRGGWGVNVPCNGVRLALLLIKRKEAKPNETQQNGKQRLAGSWLAAFGRSQHDSAHLHQPVEQHLAGHGQACGGLRCAGRPQAMGRLGSAARQSGQWRAGPGSGRSSRSPFPWQLALDNTHMTGTWTLALKNWDKGRWTGQGQDTRTRSQTKTFLWASYRACEGPG